MRPEATGAVTETPREDRSRLFPAKPHAFPRERDGQVEEVEAKGEIPVFIGAPGSAAGAILERWHRQSY